MADPFVLVDQFAAQGKLKPALVAKVKARGRYLLGAVARVEKATGLRYPPYYVEPTLPLAVTSVEYGSVGAFFARVIPTAFEGRISIIVQFTAPLLLFGTKGTVEAVAAHEFTHYVDLVRRLSRTDIVSEERVSTLFEAGYADEERVVSPIEGLRQGQAPGEARREEVHPQPHRPEARREGEQGLDREGAPHEARGPRGEQRQAGHGDGREDEVRPVAAREDNRDGGSADGPEVRRSAQG